MNEASKTVFTVRKRKEIIHPDKIHELENRYELYLDEIVDRLWVIISTTQKNMKEEVVNEYLFVDLELCMLQARKSIEVLAYMMVIAHRLIDPKVTKALRKAYNAEKIIKHLSKKNDRYFPRPVTRTPNADGSFEIIEIETVEGLERVFPAQVLQLYNVACSRFLHADHEYRRGNLGDLRENICEINSFSVRLLKTLQEHTINLDDHYVLHAICCSKDSGAPSASILSRIQKKNYFLRNP